VAAARGYLVARARYERGVSTYLDVTDAQRSALAADRAAVQINTQRLLAAVSVARAGRRLAAFGAAGAGGAERRHRSAVSAILTRKRPAANVPLVRSVRLQCGPHSTRGPHEKILLPLALAIACATAYAAPAGVNDLNKMTKRFAPIALTADTAHLSAGDKKAIAKLIEAAKIIDVLQLRQRWSGNEALWAALQKDTTPLGKARLNYFWLNKGPWSILDDHQSFLPAEVGGVKVPAKKPEGGNFYPEGATKAELENWMNALPAADKEQAQWFFTTIRKNKDGQFTVKYSDEYKAELEKPPRCSSRPPPIPTTPR
jgi:hypothetical protein